MAGPPELVDDPGAESLSALRATPPHELIAGVSAVIPGPDGPFGALEVATARRRGFTVEDVRSSKVPPRCWGPR